MSFLKVAGMLKLRNRKNVFKVELIDLALQLDLPICDASYGVGTCRGLYPLLVVYILDNGSTESLLLDRKLRAIPERGTIASLSHSSFEGRRPVQFRGKTFVLWDGPRGCTRRRAGRDTRMWEYVLIMHKRDYELVVTQPGLYFGHAAP